MFLVPSNGWIILVSTDASPQICVYCATVGQWLSKRARASFQRSERASHSTLGVLFSELQKESACCRDSAVDAEHTAQTSTTSWERVLPRRSNHCCEVANFGNTFLTMAHHFHAPVPSMDFASMATQPSAWDVLSDLTAELERAQRLFQVWS